MGFGVLKNNLGYCPLKETPYIILEERDINLFEEVLLLCLPDQKDGIISILLQELGGNLLSQTSQVVMSAKIQLDLQ